ncbi:MAG: hypothetical protein ABJB34_12830, partial [Acidobacteriota bacterium]
MKKEEHANALFTLSLFHSFTFSLFHPFPFELSRFCFVNRAHPVAGFLGSANCVASLETAFRPLGYLFERMPFEAFKRKDLAGGVTQLKRAKGDKENCEIEDHPNGHHKPAGSKT